MVQPSGPWLGWKVPATGEERVLRLCIGLWRGHRAAPVTLEMVLWWPGAQGTTAQQPPAPHEKRGFSLPHAHLLTALTQIQAQEQSSSASQHH